MSYWFNNRKEVIECLILVKLFAAAAVKGGLNRLASITPDTGALTSSE